MSNILNINIRIIERLALQHLKHLYSRSLDQLGARYHFSAHSHHLWPDITREAHLQYWDDSANQIDHKWDHILGNIQVQAQKNIAELLGVKRHADVFFASNTHDIIIKIFSALGLGKNKIKVLSTNGEFHSFSRQIQAWVEQDLVELTTVEIKPDQSHEREILNLLNENEFDITFISHVFFQSGLIVQNLERIHKAIKNGFLIIDGYHSVGSFPIELNFLEDASNVFYIGGGYKYLQAGEGACFCLVPYKHELKPHITGWFAQFGELQSSSTNKIDYATGGGAFGGATFDPSGLYRFNAAYKQMKENYTPKELRLYILELKREFIFHFQNYSHLLSNCEIEFEDISLTGSFISLRHPQAIELSSKLSKLGIFTDARNYYLRFGFAVYQEKLDIQKLFKNILCAHKPL